MGQKSSSNHRKKSRPSTSKAECTEIVDIDFTDSVEAKIENTIPALTTTLNNVVVPTYPPELLKVMGRIDELEGEIDDMTSSQIHLYFPTLKDDLHNNWEKVYGVKNTSDDVRLKKVETIEKIKLLLKKLNERFLKRNFRNLSE